MRKPNLVERLRAGGEALLRSLPPRRAYMKADPQTGEPVTIDASTGRPVATPTAADERAVADLAAALVEIGAATAPAPAPAAPARATQPVAAPAPVARPVAAPAAPEPALSAADEAELQVLAEACGPSAAHLPILRPLARRGGPRAEPVQAYVSLHAKPAAATAALLSMAEALQDRRGVGLPEAIATVAKRHPALYAAHAASVTLNTGPVASPVKR